MKKIIKVIEQYEKFCDRCGEQIFDYDASITDHLEGEYPDADICENCDLVIYQSQLVMKKSMVTGEKPINILKKMIENYED